MYPFYQFVIDDVVKFDIMAIFDILSPSMKLVTAVMIVYLAIFLIIKSFIAVIQD